MMAPMQKLFLLVLYCPKILQFYRCNRAHTQPL